MAEDKIMLTKSEATKSLKTLGYNPQILQHAFLELTLQNKNLEDITVIEQFPHIMYLNLSTNALKSLIVLNSLPNLIQLNASQNKITDVLNFAPPHCQVNNSWESGHCAAGSMLTHVNLSKNSITVIRNLKDHQFLECLLLADNQIVQISGLSSLRFLRTLDLSNNQLTTIEGLDGLPLRELRLSGNRITSLNGIDGLAHLTTLLVADNCITSLAPLAHNSSLMLVDMSRNQLQHVRQTEHIGGIQWLRTLLLQGNPCWKKQHYRLRVLYRLPYLQRLDLMNVSGEEKIRAFNLYQSPEGDRQLREQVHYRHIVDESFEDRSPDRDWRDDEDSLILGDLGITQSIDVTKFAGIEGVAEPEKYDLPQDQELVQGIA